MLKRDKAICLLGAVLKKYVPSIRKQHEGTVDDETEDVVDRIRMNAPPTHEAIAEAIARLPKPSPELPPQVVEVVAWPGPRRFRVTFVVRNYLLPHTSVWFWGIDKLQPLEPGKEPSENA